MANCKTTGVFQPSHCRGLLYDAIHGWMTGRMDGKIHKKWMTGRMDGKLHEKGPRRAAGIGILTVSLAVYLSCVPTRVSVTAGMVTK